MAKHKKIIAIALTVLFVLIAISGTALFMSKLFLKKSDPSLTISRQAVEEIKKFSNDVRMVYSTYQLYKEDPQLTSDERLFCMTLSDLLADPDIQLHDPSSDLDNDLLIKNILVQRAPDLGFKILYEDYIQSNPLFTEYDFVTKKDAETYYDFLSQAIISGKDHYKQREAVAIIAQKSTDLSPTTVSFLGIQQPIASLTKSIARKNKPLQDYQFNNQGKKSLFNFQTTMLYKPDTNQVIAGGSDKIIRLCNADLSEIITTSTQIKDENILDLGQNFHHQGDIRKLLWINDDKTEFISVSEDGYFRYWGIKDNEFIIKNSVFVSPDGIITGAFNIEKQILAIGTRSKGILYYQKKEDDFRLNRNWQFGDDKIISTMLYSPKGLVAGYEDGSITMWQWPFNKKHINIKKILTLYSRRNRGRIPLRSLSFDKDYRVLAAGYGNGNVELWDILYRKLVKRADNHHLGSVNSLELMEIERKGSRRELVLVSGGEDNRVSITRWPVYKNNDRYYWNGKVSKTPLQLWDTSNSKGAVLAVKGFYSEQKLQLIYSDAGSQLHQHQLSFSNKDKEWALTHADDGVLATAMAPEKSLEYINGLIQEKKEFYNTEKSLLLEAARLMNQRFYLPEDNGEAEKSESTSLDVLHTTLTNMQPLLDEILNVYSLSENPRSLDLFSGDENIVTDRSLFIQATVEPEKDYLHIAAAGLRTPTLCSIYYKDNTWVVERPCDLNLSFKFKSQVAGDPSHDVIAYDDRHLGIQLNRTPVISKVTEKNIEIDTVRGIPVVKVAHLTSTLHSLGLPDYLAVSSADLQFDHDEKKMILNCVITASQIAGAAFEYRKPLEINSETSVNDLFIWANQAKDEAIPVLVTSLNKLAASKGGKPASLPFLQKNQAAHIDSVKNIHLISTEPFVVQMNASLKHHYAFPVAIRIMPHNPAFIQIDNALQDPDRFIALSTGNNLKEDITFSFDKKRKRKYYKHINKQYSMINSFTENTSSYNLELFKLCESLAERTVEVLEYRENEGQEDYRLPDRYLSKAQMTRYLYDSLIAKIAGSETELESEAFASHIETVLSEIVAQYYLTAGKDEYLRSIAGEFVTAAAEGKEELQNRVNSSFAKQKITAGRIISKSNIQQYGRYKKNMSLLFQDRLDRSHDELYIVLSRQYRGLTPDKLWNQALSIMYNSASKIDREIAAVMPSMVINAYQYDKNKLQTAPQAFRLASAIDRAIAPALAKNRRAMYYQDSLVSAVLSLCLEQMRDRMVQAYLQYIPGMYRDYKKSVLTVLSDTEASLPLIDEISYKNMFHPLLVNPALEILSRDDRFYKNIAGDADSWVKQNAAEWPAQARDMLTIVEQQFALTGAKNGLVTAVDKKVKIDVSGKISPTVAMIINKDKSNQKQKLKFSHKSAVKKLEKQVNKIIKFNAVDGEKLFASIQKRYDKAIAGKYPELEPVETLLEGLGLGNYYITYNGVDFQMQLQALPVQDYDAIFASLYNKTISMPLNGEITGNNENIHYHLDMIKRSGKYAQLLRTKVLGPLKKAISEDIEKELGLVVERNRLPDEDKSLFASQLAILAKEREKPDIRFVNDSLVLEYHDTVVDRFAFDATTDEARTMAIGLIAEKEKWLYKKMKSARLQLPTGRSGIHSLYYSFSKVSKYKIPFMGRKLDVAVSEDNKSIEASFEGDRQLPAFTVKKGLKLGVKKGRFIPVIDYSQLETNPPLEELVKKYTVQNSSFLQVHSFKKDKNYYKLDYSFQPDIFRFYQRGRMDLPLIQGNNDSMDKVLLTLDSQITGTIESAMKDLKTIPGINGIACHNVKRDKNDLGFEMTFTSEYAGAVSLKGTYSVRKGLSYRLNSKISQLGSIFLQKQYLLAQKPVFAELEKPLVYRAGDPVRVPVTINFQVPLFKIPQEMNISIQPGKGRISARQAVYVPEWYSAAPYAFHNMMIGIRGRDNKYVSDGTVTFAPGSAWKDWAHVKGRSSQDMTVKNMTIRGSLHCKNQFTLDSTSTRFDYRYLILDTFIADDQRINTMLNLGGPLQIHTKKAQPYMIFKSSVDYQGVRSDQNIMRIDGQLAGEVRTLTEFPADNSRATFSFNRQFTNPSMQIQSIIENLGDFSMVRLQVVADQKRTYGKVQGGMINSYINYDHLLSYNKNNILKHLLRVVKNNFEQPLSGAIGLGKQSSFTLEDKSERTYKINRIKKKYDEDEIFIEEQKVKIFKKEWIPWQVPVDVVYIAKAPKLVQMTQLAKIKRKLKNKVALSDNERKKIDFIFTSELAEELFADAYSAEQVFHREFHFKKMGNLALSYDNKYRMILYKNIDRGIWHSVWEGKIETFNKRELLWDPIYYRKSKFDFAIFHYNGSFVAVKNGATLPAVLNPHQDNNQLVNIGKTYGIKKLLQNQRKVIRDEGKPEDHAVTAAWLEAFLYFSGKPKLSRSVDFVNNFVMLSLPGGTFTHPVTGNTAYREDNILIHKETVYSTSRLNGRENFIRNPEQFSRIKHMLHTPFADLPVIGHIEKISNNQSLVFSADPSESEETNNLYILWNNQLFESSWLYSSRSTSQLSTIDQDRKKIANWFDVNRRFLVENWFYSLDDFYSKHTSGMLPVNIILGIPAEEKNLDGLDDKKKKEYIVRLAVLFGTDAKAAIQLIASDLPQTEAIEWRKVQTQFFGYKQRLIPLVDHGMVWKPIDYSKIVVNNSWLERGWKANPAGIFLKVRN